MSHAVSHPPAPRNEPVLTYAPESPERAALQQRTGELMATELEIPLVIGGAEIHTGDLAESVCPHDHRHVLARYHRASAKHVEQAAAAAAIAWQDWQRTPWEHRMAVFLKAADLLAGSWRQTLNAATLLNQSKTSYQAEIDAACELIDFFRFNPHYARELYAQQPASSPGMWNRVEYRPLEGFVFAATPFNFTSIAGNLPTAPAMMGNTVLWKPASSSVYSAWWVFQLLREAGLPPGVINFLPGRGATVGTPALAHPSLAGVHFTGSTAVFQSMWQTIGNHITHYRAYPRIVGETGGKDFVFAHPSADTDALVVALIRGAFEFQGQKCSAASRAFIPRSLWPEVRAQLAATVPTLPQGSPTDPKNFITAVIDQAAYDNIRGYIEFARRSADAELIVGGGSDNQRGFFIEPTVVLTTDPAFKLLQEEIFGPVLTIFVYEDAALDQTLALCDQGSPYGLTGAVFAQDRAAIVHMSEALRYAAGNFYINDKPTGAVVGQQPFGGGRASGTNDKAGSLLNLIRWVSPRTIKETFEPAKDWRYPFLDP